MSERIPVAVAGATGEVGQRFVERLDEHPFFEVVAVAASDSKAGIEYGEAVDWRMADALPEAIVGQKLELLDSLGNSDVQVVFSALPSDIAGSVEKNWAEAGKAVFTNASAHRMDDNVPLLIADVNHSHLDLVEQQASPGFIVANGNCTAIILALALKPLQRYRLKEAYVTTAQAKSGAGNPDDPTLRDALEDNLLPYISGEEEKITSETRKMLGPRGISAKLPIYPTATRVNVRDGHLESVAVKFAQPAQEKKLVRAWERFCGPEDVRALPSAPEQPIHVFPADRVDRPQPRLDRNLEGGMAISIGRVRVGQQVGERVVRFVVLGHNTVRGAAGQSIFNAELAFRRGYLQA